jgi:hypothetical protein
MHTAILIVGDDPLGQIAHSDPGDVWKRTETTATKTISVDGEFLGTDWYGIGGRFTGALIPKPAATTGKVYGDAMPDVEARVLGALGERGVPASRSMGKGPGVDQLRLHDLERIAELPAAVIIDGTRHGYELDPAETAALLAAHLGVYSSRDTEAHDAALKSAHRKMDEWAGEMNRLLNEVDPNALITIIDSHQ